MKSALLIAVPLGAAITALLYYLAQRLSSDALAMMIGLMLGVLSLVPTMALVAMARHRDEEDDRQPVIIDYNPPTVYDDDVTPYTHLLRRAAGMPQLPDRGAEIAQLRAALVYLEAQEEITR